MGKTYIIELIRPDGISQFPSGDTLNDVINIAEEESYGRKFRILDGWGGNEVYHSSNFTIDDLPF
jgi:hypothetical protein